MSDNVNVINPSESANNDEMMLNDVKGKESNVMFDIIHLTLQNMFEDFLKDNGKSLEKYNIHLTPEVQKYFLEFCQENPNFFVEVENSLKTILMDNEINAKDVPELLALIIKIYQIIKNRKSVSLQGVDPYDIIELMLRVLLISYVKMSKHNNVDEATVIELVDQIIKIIKVSVELLKLPIIKSQTKGCLNCIFKKK